MFPLRHYRKFPAFATSGAAPATTSPDFCNDVLTIFSGTCSGGNCHSGSLPAAGLALVTAGGVAATAIGRAAQGDNTGPSGGAGLAPHPPPVFGQDMPIIDANGASAGAGDPGNSWLMYKVLLAVPTGPSTPTTMAHAVTWQAMSEAEREVLSGLVQGREMPYPSDPAAPLDASTTALSLDQLETISQWIGQGASVPASCP